MVSSSASAVSLVANILLLRLLSLPDAGRLVLLLACLDSITLVANFGQSTLIQRVYSRSDSSSHDWPIDLLATQVLAVPILAAGAGLSLVLYPLTFGQVVFILAVGIPVLMNTIVSSMLSASRHYAWSSLLVRLPNSLLVLPAVMAGINPNWASLNTILLCYLGTSTLVLVLALVLLSKYVIRGRLRISVRSRIVGVWFLGSQLTSILPEQGLIAIAGLLLHPAQLATYGAITVLMGPFRIISDVFRRVLMTELLQKETPASRRVRSGLWVLSLSLGLAAAVLGRPLIHVIYSGRYDEGLAFVPWLAIAGALMLAETLPRSHILGRAPRPVLGRMILGHTINGILGAFIGYGLTAGLAGLGTAMAAAFMSAGRAVVSYRIFQRSRFEESRTLTDLASDVP